MTKINLLPPEKIKKKVGAPGGNLIWLALALPLIVLIAIGVWWFSLGSQVSEKDDEIKSTKQELQDWQAKNKALEQYEVRLQEIKAKEQVVVRAVSGRIYWARILLNIADFCPNDIWLVSINCSSSENEGTVDFQGYAKQCRNRWNKNIDDLLMVVPGTPDWRRDLHPDNRFHPEGTMDGYYTYYPDYRPVANWIEKMEQIEQFARVWVSSAQPEWHAFAAATVLYKVPLKEPVYDPVTGELLGYEEVYSYYDVDEGDYVMSFSSTANLDMPNAAIGKPLGAASAPAAPAQPATQEGAEEGGEEE
ncbi:MAG: hypothetical protein JXA49_04525 [Actinobacteria bacterium]|nr:hypothetical protein [Actinomycetota bacterium]